MTVKQFIETLNDYMNQAGLNKEGKEAKIVMSRDAEGNGFANVADVWGIEGDTIVLYPKHEEAQEVSELE